MMSHFDRTFAALADPTRRKILDRLGRGEATVQELSGLAPISQPAMSHHLKVLETAGLIETRIVGQTRPRRLRTEVLGDLTDWLSRLQQTAEMNFQRLDGLLAEMAQETDQPGSEET